MNHIILNHIIKIIRKMIKPYLFQGCIMNVLFKINHTENAKGVDEPMATLPLSAYQSRNIQHKFLDKNAHCLRDPRLTIYFMFRLLFVYINRTKRQKIIQNYIFNLYKFIIVSQTKNTEPKQFSSFVYAYTKKIYILNFCSHLGLNIWDCRSIIFRTIQRS